MVDENAQAAVDTMNEKEDQVSESQEVVETPTNDEATPEVVESNGVASEDTESEDTTNENDVPDESDTPDDESREDESDEDDAEPFVPISKLRKVRGENKSLRTRLRDAESKLAERDDSVLQAQIDSLQNELRTERLANVLTPKVEAAGAIDPEILIKLVPLDSIEWGDGNQPTNLGGVIDGLKVKHPKQFRIAQGSGNTATTNEPKGKLEGMNPKQLLQEAYSKS